ncbi:MAG: hypothetical protein VKJ06_02335 [Vampirovibrionales bacterium]|nr:hypothetical protein [Vampirovibrionales bacterium]
MAAGFPGFYQPSPFGYGNGGQAPYGVGFDYQLTGTNLPTVPQPTQQMPYIMTGFGPTDMLGGVSNLPNGTPGVLNFGMTPPGFDPLFFYSPAASSFSINRLLSFTSGQSVPVHIGPTPSTLGLPTGFLGSPYYGGSIIPQGYLDLFGQNGQLPQNGYGLY